MKPSNGRTVHVNDVVGKCQPLIVSDVVGSHTVSGLLIRPSGSTGAAQMVRYSEAPYDRTVAEQTWHWPEREDS